LRSILCALLLVLAVTPSHAVPAQTAKPTTRKPAAPAPAATPAAKPAPCDCIAVTAQRHLPPYIAKQETTRVQTLADGTTITSVTESQTWRDANSRTRTETTSAQSAGTVTRLINVYDPVARVRLSWTTGTSATSKTVNVYRYPQPVPQAAPPTRPVTQRYYPYKSESLPPQTIAGIYVTGTRSTRTVPAGYEGNDRDLNTIQENWYSSELGIQMRTVSDDPRNGKTTTETTDLQQTDPDPAIFEIPQGYTVRETNPQ
jgi:hypothetical protein